MIVDVARLRGELVGWTVVGWRNLGTVALELVAIPCLTG
jgi:hypothetical protein